MTGVLIRRGILDTDPQIGCQDREENIIGKHTDTPKEGGRVMTVAEFRVGKLHEHLVLMLLPFY